MHYFVMCAMVFVTFAGYLTTSGFAPGAFKFMPEICTGIAALCVLLGGVRDRFQFVGPKYWLLFGVLAFTIIAGILVNALPTGPVISGLRLYLRPIPFFFIPAVFAFTERQWRQQMTLLLLIALIQIPLAVQQRIYWQGRGWITGDLVTGSMGDSGYLSIYLICLAFVLCALALRGKLAKWMFVVLFFLVLSPTMINETKATVVLLPLGLLLTILVASAPGKRLVIGMWAMVLLVGFGAVFVPVYDYLQKDRQYAVPLTEFFSQDDTVGRYVESGTEVGDKKTAGRLDSITVPLRYLGRDASHFTFGLGIGNVSTSSLGKNFVGKYYLLFESFTGTSAAYFLLELGVLGVGLLVILHLILWIDAIGTARASTGLMGSVAAAYAGVVPVFGLSLAYTSIHLSDGLSYLFWYWAGAIAAERMRVGLNAKQAVRAPDALSSPLGSLPSTALGRRY